LGGDGRVVSIELVEDEAVGFRLILPEFAPSVACLCAAGRDHAVEQRL
jgi:hypothetical protein